MHLFCQMHTLQTYAHFWKSVHETAPRWRLAGPLAGPRRRLHRMQVLQIEHEAQAALQILTAGCARVTHCAPDGSLARPNPSPGSTLPAGSAAARGRLRPSRRCTDLPRQENTCHLVRAAAHARTATGPSLSGPVGRLTLDGTPREPPPDNSHPPA